MMFRRMLRWAFRTLVQAVVRFYYPRRDLLGGALVPMDRPVIFVLNHPNGLLDPLVLEQALGRPVSFLAKSTLFGNPVGRLAMETFGAIAVYRSQDLGGPSKSLVDRNEATFAAARAALSAGRWLALFPEGVSHSESRLRPLKSGAARLAISAEEESLARTGMSAGLVLLPIGLVYEDKTVFRTAVRLVVGQGIDVGARIMVHREAQEPSIDGLTQDIRAGLEDVLLEADTRALVAGIARVASWTVPSTGPHAAQAQHDRAKRMLAVYADLAALDPDRLNDVVGAAQTYARLLRRLGVADPWALELESVRPLRAAAVVLQITLMAPLALMGAVMGYLPYRLAELVARRMIKGETDLMSTVKLLAGGVFLPVTWALESVLVASFSNRWMGIASFFTGLVAGYVALRFNESLAEVTEAIRHLWLRSRKSHAVVRLVQRRRELADKVAAVLLT